MAGGPYTAPLTLVKVQNYKIASAKIPGGGERGLREASTAQRLPDVPPLPTPFFTTCAGALVIVPVRPTPAAVVGTKPRMASHSGVERLIAPPASAVLLHEKHHLQPYRAEQGLKAPTLFK